MRRSAVRALLSCQRAAAATSESLALSQLSGRALAPALGMGINGAGIGASNAAPLGQESAWHPAAALRGFASSGAGQETSTIAEDDQACNVLDIVQYAPPQAFVGQPAPTFTAPAVIDGEIGELSLSQYRGKYVVLFFYPKDWTFVCPTEIIAFSDRVKEFEALNCQVIAASCDTENSHLAWVKHPRERGGLGYMQIPIVADTKKTISAAYGVLIEDAGVALRGLFIIDPKGMVRQITINDLPIGRSVDETLRLLQAIQFYEEHGEVCPADWKPGAPTMVADPEKSQDYFSKVAHDKSSEEEFGSKLHQIKSKRDYEQLVASGKKVVVDFMAPWCGKCRMIAPHVDKLQEQYPDIVFAKFDTTLEPLEGLSSELGVKALPAFHFFKDGKQVHEPIVGYKKAPLADVVSKL